MKQILIIGYGNPCRADDGIGWHAIDCLAKGPLPKGVEAVAAHQLTPELAERISHFDLAIFIDACWDRLPGRIGLQRLEPSAASAGSFTHQVDPAALLSLARLLYGRSPEAFLLAVGGESFAHGEELSLSVKACLPDLLKRVQGLMHQPGSQPGRGVYA